MNQARKILEEFDDRFGDTLLGGAEGDWLCHKIAEAIQGNRDVGRAIGWDAAKRDTWNLLSIVNAAR